MPTQIEVDDIITKLKLAKNKYENRSGTHPTADSAANHISLLLRNYETNSSLTDAQWAFAKKLIKDAATLR